MRIRAVVAVGAGAAVLAGAALAPALLATETPPPPRELVVPFELSGLYATSCLERTVSTGGAVADDLALTDCLDRYEVEPLSPSIYFDGFHRAMYAGYFAGELVPCLRAHGLTVETPTQDLAPPADLSSWYLRIVLGSASFDQAITTWYDCPLVPTFLEDAVRTRDGVVE